MAEIGLDHVAVVTRDVERSVAFYAEVLGLEDAFPGLWDGVPVMMLAPGSRSGVAIFPEGKGGRRPTGRPAGVVDHFAFRTSREGYEAFKARLDRLGVSWHEQDHDASLSVYFKDPDGHTVEMTTYEVGGRGAQA